MLIWLMLSVFAFSPLKADQAEKPCERVDGGSDLLPREMRAVLAGDGSDYIVTIPKGSRGHNYQTETGFTYQRDAIFTGSFHCCGDSLLWRNGRFIRIPTSD